ncbi:hypothetical protein D5F01_LYC22473 [Larimichthys crocea]|uniref:Uncharacterized protein n=1 Tax=Larimichthys crocea TaxID=215358 RepID=A0A6G0HIH7_LARCR|nr:hypothetical protein D5F01_LYC22473 [Larimichthys crocea]
MRRTLLLLLFMDMKVSQLSSEPEENSVKELTTSPDLDVEMNEVNEQPASHEESVVFEMNSNDDDGPPSLHLETPRERHQPHTGANEAEGEELTHCSCCCSSRQRRRQLPKHMRLLQELREERDKASQRSIQDQAGRVLPQEVRGRRPAGEGAAVSEQLREYEKHMSILRPEAAEQH